MKKVLFITIMMLALVAPVMADEITPRWNLAKKGAGIGAGIAAGFMFHEIGHQVVAGIEGSRIEWLPDVTWEIDEPDQGKVRNVALAGFGAQVLSTEVMLGWDKIPKDNSFVLGWLGFNILNSVLYGIKDEIDDGLGGYGDLGCLKQTGMDTNIVKVGLLVHSALSTYRLFKNPDFPLYVEATGKEIQMGLRFSF